MGKKHDGIIGNDSLELLDTEIEELENDEISLEEAGFLFGYENEKEEDDWWVREDIQIKQTEGRMGEVA